MLVCIQASFATPVEVLKKRATSLDGEVAKREGDREPTGLCSAAARAGVTGAATRVLT